MGILQSGCNLPDIGHKDHRGQARAPPVTLAQGTIWGIIHDQKRHEVLNIIVQHPYDMRMYEVSNSKRLVTELLNVLTCQLSMQHLDSRLRLKMDMFA